MFKYMLDGLIFVGLMHLNYYRISAIYATITVIPSPSSLAKLFV